MLFIPQMHIVNFSFTLLNCSVCLCGLWYSIVFLVALHLSSFCFAKNRVLVKYHNLVTHRSITNKRYVNSINKHVLTLNTRTICHQSLKLAQTIRRQRQIPGAIERPTNMLSSLFKQLKSIRVFTLSRKKGNKEHIDRNEWYWILKRMSMLEHTIHVLLVFFWSIQHLI